MEITIKTSSSRNKLEWIDTDESFSDGLNKLEEEKYSFEARIEVYKETNLIGEIYGIVFDEEAIENEGEDLEDVADMIDGDVEGAMGYLVRSDIYKKEIDGELALAPLFDCYIQNYFLYSKDENENRIVSEYLFKNLNDIFLHCYGTHIRCFVTYPAPQHIDDCGHVVDTPDKDGTIKETMIEFHKKMGYTPLGKSGYFGVTCVK
jgi:hypothetical protein